tara:strand:- start:407 stop:955 length:549 start_codon:yes stop_codon:yes gene_type:complete
MLDWTIESRGEKYQVEAPVTILGSGLFKVYCNKQEFYFRWQESTRTFFQVNRETGLEKCLRVKGGFPLSHDGENDELSYQLDDGGTQPVFHRIYPSYLEIANRFRGRKTGQQLIKASITGKVLGVFKAAGEPIAAGEKFAVIEAMKMENNIVAPCAGICTEIMISEGNMVSMGSPLMMIKKS